MAIRANDEEAMMWMKRNKAVSGIDVSMGRIRELAQQINAATDEANAAVMRAEKFLSDECGVGIPVSVVVGERDSGLEDAARRDSKACRCHGR